MFKDKVTYIDYDGNERTDTLYFNLSKAELLKMETSLNGGYSAFLEKVVESKDTPSIMKAFQDIIEKAYGKKSDDGRRFIKSEEITEEFLQSEAYSEFLMKLISDENYAANFVTGILPKQDNIVAMPSK